jgi:hypothetical protein
MIYLIVFIWLLYLVIKYDIIGIVDNKNINYYIVLFVLTLIAGLRYKVGGDTLIYFEDFKNTPDVFQLFSFDFESNSFEPFWIIFQSICKSLFNDFAFFQLIHALFVNAIIFWFIKKNTVNYFTAIFLYFCWPFFYFNMEIMRESIAIVLFLIGYDNFKNNKWVPFYSLATIAFLFHSSALVLFLLPFLKGARFNFFGFIIIGLTITISTYYKNLIEVGLFFTRISTKLVTYLNTQELNLNGIIVGFLMDICFPIFIIWFHHKFVSKYQKFKDLFFTFIFLSFLSLIIQGSYRLLNYFTVFILIFLADFFMGILKNKKVSTLIRIVFVSFFLSFIAIPKILYFTADTSKFSAKTRMYNRWYPYSSIFYEEEYYFRSSIYEGSMGY